MSRRAFLATGAGGVVAAAAGGGAVLVGDASRARRWLHGRGYLDAPSIKAPAADVAVRESTLASRHIGRDVAWAMALPAAPPAALLLCLHGRGAAHGFAFEPMEVHRFVAGAGLPWVVAAVDGGEASFWHRRADGTDASAMVFEELLPVVRQAVGDVPLGLLGWSMGGYGALLAAIDRRDQVQAVAATAPALWRSFSEARPGAFDDAADFETHDVLRRLDRLAGLPVRIDCGRDDALADVARLLADRLPHAESDFGPGYHDADTWRTRLPAQLDFFRRAFPTPT